MRSKLAEVVGLGRMTKGIYTDHIAHHVELYRKKEQDQREQDQETLRKLTQIQLIDNTKKEKAQALVMHSQSQLDQQSLQQQPDQNQFHLPQTIFVAPIASSPQPVFGQPQTWRARGGNINPSFQQSLDVCYNCEQLGHYAHNCDSLGETC